MTADPVPDRFRAPAEAARIALVAACYAGLLAKPLVRKARDPLAALWAAPCAVLAHGTEDDPRFFFANRAALIAFEAGLDQLIGLPSRFSAEAPERNERQGLLDRVSTDGFIDDYRGIRITTTGRRFEIRSAVVWNLVDEAGVFHGQAARFVR